MLRFALLVGLALASCKGSGPKPAGSASGAASAPGSGSASGSVSGSGSASAAGAGLAKPLRGPFATIDAYCETRPKSDDRKCSNADVTPKGALPTGLLEAATVYESNDGPSHDIGCAVALRTAAGWFVGPSSAEICREPSYIELEGLDIETDGAIAAITFSVAWHTKDFDREAKYKLAALCGIDRGGVPACTPVFLSQCEVEAPVSGCDKKPFELSWTLDGDTATFTHDRKIDNDAVPFGKQTILGGR